MHRAEHSGGGYDAYRVKDLDGKEWKIVRDGSIHPECRRRSVLIGGSGKIDLDMSVAAMLEDGGFRYVAFFGYFIFCVPLALAISQKVLNGRGAWRLQGGGFAGLHWPHALNSYP